MTVWTDLLGVSFSIEHVDAGGVPTRSLRAGTRGDHIIFLHGMSGHLEAFSSVVANLSKDFQLHLIDSLNHGFTGQAGRPVTMDRFAAHLMNYMDATGIDSTHLVGLSQGGWIAGWMAAEHPHRVKSAIMMAAAGDPRLAANLQGEWGQRVLQLTREGVLSTDKTKTRKRLELVIHDPAGISDELVDIRYAVYQRPEFQAGLENLMAMMHAQEYAKWAMTPERLSKIEAEVLVVWGLEDTQTGAVPWKYLSEGIARNKLVLFKDTNHWPQYERPAEFNDLAGAFLRGGLAAVTEGTI